MLKLLKENWEDYTIQLCLVIFGIVIPFVIAKWVDSRKGKKLGRKYVEMLINDLNEDLTLLKFNYRNIDIERNALVAFAGKFDSSDAIKEKELTSVIPSMVKYYHFIPLNATFNDLESTGNMNLVSTLKGRRALFGYYRLSKLITRMEETYEKEAEGFLKPAILKHFPIRRLQQYEFAFGNSVKFPINIEAISNDVNFENAILIKIDLLNNLYIMYSSLITLNRETVTELSK